MYLSLKIYGNDNDDGGRIEVWKRGSITCTHAAGTLFFDNKEELDVLLEMLMNGHPEVSIMENNLPTGCFVDTYYQWPQRPSYRK
ncbi:MAG: hypothetical protein E4H30_03255 [Methanomassiliicoccus sp.]|nr:MAG: hypothetical protein E4H30_03255 [Methanomassiliicoccus sp.]